MKTIIVIMFAMMATACSNESSSKDVSKGTHQETPVLKEQTDIQDINRNSNLIRTQTERTFRSVTPDSSKSDNPLTPPPIDKSRSD